MGRSLDYRINWNAETFAILIYLFLSSPFLIFGIFFTNFLIPYFFKAIVMLFLLPKVISRRISAKGVILIFGCFVYLLYHVLLHSQSAGRCIGDTQDIIFCVMLWTIISKSKKKHSYVAISFYLSILVSALLLIQTLCFLVYPSFFSLTELVEYEVFYNKYLGMINIDNLRPCWFFAEPSYCGAFLAINLFIFYKHNFKKRRQKSFYYALLIGGLIVTASFGAFVAIGLTIGILISERLFHLNRLSVLLILGVLLMIFMIVFPNFERDSEMSAIRTNSMEVRQERVKIAAEVRDNMTIKDALFGLGPNAVAFKYEVGLSDAYNKLYIENGLIYMFIYFMIVYSFLKNNTAVLSYYILSLMTVIAPIFPLTLFCLMIASIVSHDDRKLKYYNAI